MTDLHPPQQPPTPAPPAGRRAPGAPPSEDDRGHPVRLAILGALVGLLGVTGGWPMLVVVLGVVVMIFLHELGHYLAAKWGGMKVSEFFIGFGPKIWSFQRGETEYGLKAIPAGAYVKIVGMNNLDEVEEGDEAHTYRSKSYPKRMLVAVAGSAMHFTQAMVLLFVLFAFVGIPGGSLDPEKLTAWEVGDVAPDTAAEDAGLLAGDEIVALDGTPVDDYGDFRDTVLDLPGEDVVLTVARDGERLDLPTTIGVRDADDGEPARGLLGILPDAVPVTVGPVDAVTESVTSFGDQTALTLGFFGDFFTPSGISEFAGDVTDGPDDAVVSQPEGGGTVESSESPDDGRIISIVGAVQIGANLTEGGMLGFLVFFIGINITIGIFNLLPVLPLDGGHVVVATYERIREVRLARGERYHVDFAKLIPVVYAVFFLLVMLGITTIYMDLADPVSL